MKTLYSCLIILAFFISCDNASDITEAATTSSELFSRTATELPGNAANPYDDAGWIHNEIFESYYESGNKPTTLSGIITKVETLADANTGFQSLKTTSYHPVSVTRIQYLLDHKNTCVAEVLSASSMSSRAKLSFSSFINSLDVVFDTETNCDVLYQFVVDYEKEILNDTLLTAKDKQIILTTTSIARHSAYLAKKKPKKNTDPDWTILIVNVIGAVDGAEFGTAESLVEGLVCGIATN